MGILLCVASSAVLYAGVSRDQEVVSSFYPEELVKAANDSDPGAPFNRISCFVRIDEETIVAGYSNDTLGAVLLLKKKEGKPFAKVFQVRGLDLAGTDCSIEATHLSRKQDKQAIVSFAAASGNSIDWIFDIMPGSLVNIGPISPGRGGIGETLLTDTDVVDLDQNGELQVVSSSEYPSSSDGSAPAAAMSLYRLVDGRLQLDKNVSVLFETSLSEKKGEKPVTFHFQKPIGMPGPLFTLRVVNGDWMGEHRSDGGTILLNGMVVALFDRRNDIVNVKVPLDNNNTIEIRANCRSGEKLVVAVISGSDQQPTNEQ